MTTRTMDGQRLVGVVLKFVGTLFALYLVREAWLERDAHQNQTRQLERELADKHQKTLNHDGLVTQLQEMRDLLAPLMQRLPSKLDSSTTIEKVLRDQASRGDIKIASLRLYAEVVREGFYVEHRVDLVAEGSTADFVKFMDGMLRDSPLRRVTAMKVEPADNPGTVRATITANYYHYIDE